MRALNCGLVLAIGMGSVAALAESRTWTNRTGKQKTEAELIDFDNGNVWLRIPERGRTSIPLGDLSAADQDYVQKLWAQRCVRPKAEVEADPRTIRYAKGRHLCDLTNRAAKESSGIAASWRNPGLFWTHNDSGYEPRIYLFDKQGRDLGSCLLKGVEAFDWEDIASFRWQGKP
jgi:hypothetical protein